MQTRRMAAAWLLAALLTGCAAPGPKTVVGAAGTAAAGGLLGSQLSKGNTPITIASVLIGLLAGGAIGNALDQRDQQLAAAAMRQALVTDAPVQWRSQRTHSTYGTVTPQRTYTQTQMVQGHAVAQHCREYQVQIVVGGRASNGFGKACQEPNGDWRIVQ